MNKEKNTMEYLLNQHKMFLENIEQNLEKIKKEYESHPNVTIDSLPTDNKTSDLEIIPLDEPLGVGGLNTSTMPIEVVTRAFKSLYPNTKAIVVMSSVLRNGYGRPCGRTIYQTNKDIPCLVELADDLPLKNLSDILAHEYAHVVCGKEADHNQHWKDTANAIYQEANRLWQKEMKPIKNIYY